MALAQRRSGRAGAGIPPQQSTLATDSQATAHDGFRISAHAQDATAPDDDGGWLDRCWS
jgi:hypothetical protein